MGSRSWTYPSSLWQAAFEMAWESHRVGSPGVGAVVADCDGRIVARGRSRRAEESATPNQLAGSRMAHAEINALAGLAVDQYEGLSLYVSLEPCLLCASAIAISHVPRVLFAGEDPMWRYLQRLPEWEPRLAARWPKVEGPLPGRWGAWGTIVPLLERLDRDPRGERVEEFQRVFPGLMALARQLLASGEARALREMDLDDAIDAVWNRLPTEEVPA